MLRYGKKLDRRHDDKLGRSNRGRARTSAMAKERKHANLGHRRSQAQLVKIRADKKRDRLAAQLVIQDELFDLELSKRDPETWLHGTDLTTFEDTVTKQHWGYSSSLAADLHEYVPDALDWDWEGSTHQGDDWDWEGSTRQDDDWDWEDGSSHLEPEPIETAWRDLWVAGLVHDPEGRDLPDPCDDHCYDYDQLVELENPLLEREDSLLPATIEEAVEGRNAERHRAGERYFKQTGRTVFVPSRSRTDSLI